MSSKYTNHPNKTAPPPPPPPSSTIRASTAKTPSPPSITSQGPPGSFLVELLIYNGHPFKDHWAYRVRSSTDPDLGVRIHATGDVRNGFKFEIERGHDLRTTLLSPTKVIPLQWVDGRYFDENAMLNHGEYKIDNVPVCQFEDCLYRVKVPGKSLNTISDTVASAGNVGKKVTQRDCQTWIVESAEQLVKDCIFNREIASFLCDIQQ